MAVFFFLRKGFCRGGGRSGGDGGDGGGGGGEKKVGKGGWGSAKWMDRGPAWLFFIFYGGFFFVGGILVLDEGLGGEGSGVDRDGMG